MFCGNCGSNVLEGAVLCPNCGKSLVEKVMGNNPSAQMGGTIGFVRSVFRLFFVIGIWIDLIISAIIGGIIGNLLHGYLISFGVFMGLLIGFYISINVRGLIATFLNIDENLKEQNKLLRESLKSKITSPNKR